MTKKVFVFGSNLGGFHGAGSAKAAMDEHGAIYGIGVGPAGNSYAIPTKDSNIECLPLETIQLYVEQFIDYAQFVEDYEDEQAREGRCNKEHRTEFRIVDIGCGLAGFTPEEIAPMFEVAPDNCVFLGKFKDVLNNLTTMEEVVNG
jgi:hypothetical protein